MTGIKKDQQNYFGNLQLNYFNELLYFIQWEIKLYTVSMKMSNLIVKKVAVIVMMMHKRSSFMHINQH